MATIHIPESEAAQDFAKVMNHIRTGSEVVIESGSGPVAILSAPPIPRRTIEECIALLSEDSCGVMDEDFAKDVIAAIEAHSVPLSQPALD